MLTFATDSAREFFVNADGIVALGDANGGLMTAPEVLENLYPDNELDCYGEPRSWIEVDEIEDPTALAAFGLSEDDTQDDTEPESDRYAKMAEDIDFDAQDDEESETAEDEHDFDPYEALETKRFEADFYEARFKRSQRCRKHRSDLKSRSHGRCGAQYMRRKPAHKSTVPQTPEALVRSMEAFREKLDKFMMDAAEIEEALGITEEQRVYEAEYQRELAAYLEVDDPGQITLSRDERLAEWATYEYWSWEAGAAYRADREVEFLCFVRDANALYHKFAGTQDSTQVFDRSLHDYGAGYFCSRDCALCAREREEEEQRWLHQDHYYNRCGTDCQYCAEIARAEQLQNHHDGYCDSRVCKHCAWERRQQELARHQQGACNTRTCWYCEYIVTGSDEDWLRWHEQLPIFREDDPGLVAATELEVLVELIERRRLRGEQGRCTDKCYSRNDTGRQCKHRAYRGRQWQRNKPPHKPTVPAWIQFESVLYEEGRLVAA